MGGWKRGRSEASVPEAPDVDIRELVPELRDLFSEYPALPCAGADELRRALHALRGIQVDVCAVEAVLEALSVEGQVLA